MLALPCSAAARPHPHARCRPLALRRLPRLLQLLAKAAFQLLTMLWLLLAALPRPDVILLQLPPALPTMLVCRVASLRHRCRLVFDWHNFAYTLMAIGMGRGHPVVSIRGVGSDWASGDQSGQW